MRYVGQNSWIAKPQSPGFGEGDAARRRAPRNRNVYDHSATGCNPPARAAGRRPRNLRRRAATATGFGLTWQELEGETSRDTSGDRL